MNKPTVSMGLIVIAVGLLPIAMGAEPSQGVPEWMVPLTCSIFVLGGLSILTQGLGFPKVSNVLGPLIILIFAICFTWIGFAPGERHCSSSISFLSFTQKKSSGCQAFGYFGILTFIIFFWALGYSITQGFRKKK